MSTVVLTEPFNNLTAWTLGVGGTITAGGFVGNFVRFTGNVNRGYPIPSGSQSPYIDVTFYWRSNNIGAANYAMFDVYSDQVPSVIEMRLNVTTAGAISVQRGGGATLGTTSGVTLVANTWYQIRLVARLADASNGTVRVDINGTTRLSLGPLLTYNTTPNAASITLRNISGLSEDFDELVLSTGAGVSVKTWNGSAFVSAPLKVWSGSAFVDASALKTWNGTSFV